MEYLLEKGGDKSMLQMKIEEAIFKEKIDRENIL
jgi:hypothetical protein